MTGFPDFSLWDLIRLPFALLWDVIKSFFKEKEDE